MKIQKKKFLILFFTLLSIFISVYVWEKLNFSYSNQDIISFYSLKNYSSLNDPIKFLIFILFPLVTFLSLKLILDKKKINTIYHSFEIGNNSVQNKSISLVILLFFILILFFEFLSNEFPYHKLDMFHSGQRLSATYKSYLDNSLWSGSYITSGIITEILGPKLVWKIFSYQSIGLVRYYEILLILFTKISLIILAFKITKIINLKEYIRPIFFIILSFILLTLIDYDINSADEIEARELPIIIFLICFLNFLNDPKNNISLSILVIAFFSVFTLFWSLDRAIVYNLLVFSFLIYLSINKYLKLSFYILIFISLFWIVLYLYLGEEFSYFIHNSLDVFKNTSDIHGLIHPTPFSSDENSARATKTLLVILFLLIYVLNSFLKVNKNKFKVKHFFFVLGLCSFFSYIYALGRSDGGHIKQAFGFPTIFISILILYFLSKFIGKLNFRYINQLSKIVQVFLFIFIVIVNFKFSSENILNYTNNFKKFIYSEDEKFMQNDDIDFVNEASIILQNEKCIQLYTYDSVLLYLLKKPSCTKFHFIWSIASLDHQNNLINEMKNNTNVIITNGKTDNWEIPLEKKYFKVDEYINQNFKKTLQIGNRNLMFMNY